MRLRSLPLVALAAATLLACKPDPVVVNPEDKPVDTTPVDAAPVWPEEPYRAERPKPREIATLQIPEIRHFTLDNGLEVYLVQQQTLPTVMMSFEFDIGDVDDPGGKSGLGSLCADLLDESTKSKDKAAFSAARDDHAVDIWASAATETTSISVRTLQRELPAALDLLAEMILEPGLRADDFERLVKQRKNSIEQSKGSPTSLAYRVLPPLIWGSSHPYGKIETDKSIDKVSLSDCKRWVSKLRPGGARLWIVGNIDEAQIREQIGQRLAKWTGKSPASRKLPEAAPAKGTIFFVHVADAAQSQIIVAHPGPARTAEDYEATQLVAAILGGSFSSRINMN
ncbi:MAG: insulinase family protein, partial [Myxococcales bacterium]|nr:insulinase family protein [Myxococcales bacterium]